MSLKTPIDQLPRTKGSTIKILKTLGIKNYFDLLNYFPSRYEDYSMISKIRELQPGETVTIIGKVVDAKFQITKSGTRIQAFKIGDETGVVSVVFFNQPFLLRLLKKGMNVSISGLVKIFGNKISIEPKQYEIVYDEKYLKHTGRIIPVYPEKKGLSSKTIREKIFYLSNEPSLDQINEILPEEILSFNNLIPEGESYKQIHFPKSIVDAQKAKHRLSFDELFTIQLSSKIIKNNWEKEIVGHKYIINAKYDKLINGFIETLPFKLTFAQLKVWEDIKNDLVRSFPMNRFLQGEVGSGKTVVAALASYLSYINGFQTLLMAPTEILAQQHYKTIFGLMNNGLKKTPTISLITGSTKKIDTKADIIIGTHSLISKKNIYKKIGLVIVDEQHRFGVEQRAAIKSKGLNPHLLTMTATPIPRTVALTLYGELDISVINEMPKNRTPVKSFFVSKAKRNDCYNWIKKQILEEKIQVFIVCPLIEESEVETMKSIKAASAEFEHLKNNVFTDFRLGLLHGRLKSKEKETVMNDFKKGKYDILVSTPVVEVGVDIPNATVMIIEAAERFGLASLHQLRGRVGRGNKQSYCFVFSEMENPTVISKLNYFAKTTNGNELAERDLEIRGSGNIFGTEQHGLINLKIASLSDYDMIKKTKNAVDYFVKNNKPKDYPQLYERLKKYKTEEIAKD